MKINKIKTNNYGKLADKEIELKDNINIIYGKNESGKSTILNFISNSFYGISKNKRGKEISNYEKYMPWVGEEFSGKLEYELDNGEKYEIFRDFKKKNPNVFNDEKEEISKQFNIDKTKGNEFFYEQTKVDEELFLSTVVVNQQEVKLGKQEQNILIQKLANLVGTGDDNVSYKRAIERINRRQLDEIGTQRSREKPINIIEKNIENLEKEKEELEEYKETKYEIEENKNKLNTKIEALENKNNYLKEIKLLNENEKIEQEKIKLKDNIIHENTEKISRLKAKIDEIKSDNKDVLKGNRTSNKNKKDSKLNVKLILFFVILLIINAVQYILIKNDLVKYLFFITIPVYLFICYSIKSKSKKKIKEEDKKKAQKYEQINSEINNINNQINIIEKNNEELEEQISKLKGEFNLKRNLEREKIKNKYSSKIEEDISLENINLQIQNMENDISNKKIKLHTLDLDKENIEPRLESLSKIEEELVNNKEKMYTLKSMETSMNLAKEIINDSYEEMKNTVTPKFTQNLSQNISEITNGKYTNIRFNDETGLTVELENGNYVSAEQLSVGTIEQLYLSLRLSMVEELSEERMPIILDEVFAYYDIERLSNILKYINDKYSNHQIIILTCTSREKELLEKLNIDYNYITI